MTAIFGSEIRKEFAFDGIQLNGAFMHPVPLRSVKAMQDYLDVRLMNANSPLVDMPADRAEAQQLFAQLIGADPDEIAWVSSTTVGENLVLASLGLVPGSNGRIVTDAYHFPGSLHLYNELRKQGGDVEIVMPRDSRIDLEDLAKAITPGTRLVAISLVSAINGFQHDLKAVCELAHSRGALVYADIVQAAGSVPLDVHASGVDFCACSTYKWLMGDFGAGFLYVRRNLLEQIQRSQFGYRQLAHFTSHIFPFDEPGVAPFQSRSKDNVAGYFEVGSLSNGAVAALKPSLRWLLELGQERITNHRAPLLRRLQETLPGMGYSAMTAPESSSALVSFACADTTSFAERMRQANIHISIYRHRFRISLSFHNDMDDVEKLFEALS
ncbi:aminotransferase class V-fold PLP-dependent enzyme [Pseudomonas putida]|uniref:aminotransferase class V-fold PLP-dependent enzyme n=1 Tax=Pseudomonas putida TaxID=303 RepID=UPI0009A14D5C|nr:aminotransferase class V-fold PLP-dependent enzyme [Pseudomonas putida]